MEGRAGEGVRAVQRCHKVQLKSGVNPARRALVNITRESNTQNKNNKRFAAVTEVANMDFPFSCRSAHVLLILLINRSAASFPTSRRSKRRSFVSDQL
jgi:hypothetical protein